MTSKLEKILKKIHPEQTYDTVSARADTAFNSFKLTSNLITSSQKFQEIGADFYCHLENQILDMNPPRKTHFIMDWGRFHKKLVMIYGQNGDKAGFDIARTGKENGLYSVLKSVADKMIDEYANSIIKSEICQFWDNMTIDEKFSAIHEYIEKFGHLLPIEIIEKGAPRIVSNFHKVLEEHPRMINRSRNMARKF
jgi:hypothetical protein